MTVWDLKSGMKFMTENGKIYEIHGSYICGEKGDDTFDCVPLVAYQYRYNDFPKATNVWNENGVMIFCGELSKEELEDKIKRQEQERKQQEWENLKYRLKKQYREYADIPYAYSCLKKQFGYCIILRNLPMKY